VTFLDAELEKTAKPKLEGVPGYLVERGTFVQTLAEASVAAGAELRQDWAVADVRLHEDMVELISAAGESIQARMMLAAVGLQAPLMERLLPGGRSRLAGRWTAQVERKVGKSKAAGKGGSLSVVLGLDRQGAFGVVMAWPGRVAVALSAAGETGEAVPGLLADLCQRLAAKSITSVDLSTDAPSATVRHVPANVALEMDSHVSKHTLIIGHAGGFVAAASDEAIYPAMWSAKIAVEVVHRALSSRHSQDVLMEFDSEWRLAMAEYLRPPNTDTQFLIPLIFSNQPMADRMAAAFFAGENI
jgi:flavin-dependent dehydrogenase